MRKRPLPAFASYEIAEAGIGTVQKRPDGAIPGSQSWCCFFGSPTASGSKRSIQMNPNVPLCSSPARSTYEPCMKRMSVSKLYLEPSLPVALP